MQIRPRDIPSPVIEICRTLARHGHRSWVVGGCLRDLLRGERPKDWDLATDALPERVMSIFPRVIATGIQHGTVTVRRHGASYEVTTLRGEGAYSDGRRPDSVHFVTQVRDDLARRDFTINALAYDPVAEVLEDPFGGLADLAARTIRAVGEPALRFGEDGLRVLRAARFVATLEFELDPATEAAIRPTLDTFRRVSAERVRDEWVKALAARAPARAFAVMRRTGILEVTCLALAELPDNVWASTLAGLDGAPKDPCVRIAALLWPLRTDLGGVDDWLTRYRFSSLERERILRMLAHARPAVAPTEATAVRRYARAVGRAHLDEVRALSEVVARAHEGEGSPEAVAARELSEQVRRHVTAETPLTVRELALGGRELMSTLGLPPGPPLGRLLEALLERALRDPDINTRDRLLAAARELAAEGE